MEIQKGMADFMYAKANEKYEWVNLNTHPFDNQVWSDYRIILDGDNPDKVFDVLTDNFDVSKDVCLCENLHYHYKFEDGTSGPLLARIPFFEGVIIKGRHLPRSTYLESSSSILLNELYKINQELVTKINYALKKPIYLIDSSLLLVNAGRLPLDKITYFKGLIVCYEKAERHNY